MIENIHKEKKERVFIKTQYVIKSSIINLYIIFLYKNISILSENLGSMLFF
jgi:hypothetical protein